MFMRCGKVSSHTSCQHAAAVASLGPQHLATSPPPLPRLIREVPRGKRGAAHRHCAQPSARWLGLTIISFSLCRLPRKRASRRHRCVSLHPPSYGTASSRAKQAMTMANITPEPHKDASRASPRTGVASVRGPSAFSRLKTEPV